MKIQDILKQAKPCWKYAATDKDGVVWFFSAKPVIGDTCWMCKANIEDCVNIHDYLDKKIEKLKEALNRIGTGELITTQRGTIFMDRNETVTLQDYVSDVLKVWG